ncbi:MAG: extracellular solute-binding protein [Ktedonobacteraceae bacterium]|nr:extracellular solute-binding protein [Ktedonobacteraceae bacterium]
MTTLVREKLAPALRQAHGITLESQPGHSVALARAIKEQRLHGDVYLSADAEANQILLGPTNSHQIRSFVTFARNRIVLAYSPRSPFLADFEQARQGRISWYHVLLRPGIRLRRNNPNHDPLGYYTLLVCALATVYYQIPDLAQRLLGDATNPEQVKEAYIADLERGEVDALFLYGSGAVERRYPFIALPDEINLSNPVLATTYAKVQYTTDTGQTFHGKSINFSAAVLNRSAHPQAAWQVVAFLLSSAGQQLVQAAHFLPGSSLIGGDATTLPQQIQPLLKGMYPSFD